MFKLNYLVDELFGDVGDGVEVKRHHASHLVLIYLDKVDAGVAADHDLVAQAGRLHLVDVANGLEALADVETERADGQNIDEAVVLPADYLVIV